MTDKNTNIQWLDSIRVMATLGVILIHISTPVVNMCWNKNMPYWWIGNIIDSTVRNAVPLFLMLSGATLLGREYRLKDFYQRRFGRVLIPFLFWLVVYIAYWWFTRFAPTHPNHDFAASVQWAVQLFLHEGISKHFWYIYMILFIYLIIPFLGKWLKKLNLTTISNILLLWALLAYLCKSTPLNMYNWSVDYGSKFLGYFLYTGYLVLGYYLYKLPVNASKLRPFAGIVFVLTIAVSAGTTYLLSAKAHSLDLNMYAYLSINTIIQSIALFLLFKDFTVKNRLISTVLRAISQYSYGIFMVHIIVIDVLYHNGIFWTISNPALSLPLIEILVAGLSMAVIFILRKIPYGKHISG